MKKNKLVKLGLTVVLFLNTMFGNSQNKINVNFKSYELCRMVDTDATDCEEIKYAPTINKIEIVPSQSVVIYINDKAYQKKWDPSSLSIIENMFVYKIMNGDPRQGGISVNLIMNQDYSFYSLVSLYNKDGIIYRIAAFDKS